MQWLGIIVEFMFIISLAHCLNWRYVKSTVYPYLTSPFAMNSSGSVATERIFGGSSANPHSFPFQAGMLVQRPYGIFWCGGSIISDEFVLTAAHCVYGGQKAVIFLGAHDIRNPFEPGQQRVFVGRENFIIHPTWNPKHIRNDIALIRIPDAIEFSDTLQPIELPKKSVPLSGKFAVATGWGKYSIGKGMKPTPNISRVLRFVNVEIVDDAVCSSTFPSTYTSRNVCTSGKNGKSTCMGDSGGPLVVRKKKSKKYVLIGITSFGSIFGCNKGFPSAYTKVSSFTDWIDSNSNVFRSSNRC